MTSRKIWARDGCRREKSTTSPRATAVAQHPLHGLLVGGVEQRVAAVRFDDLDPGFGAEPAGVAGGDQFVAQGRVLGAQVFAGAGRADPALGDDDEVVAESLDDVELVAGEQHGRAGHRAILEHVDHDIHRDRIESRERLVEDEHLGIVHESGRDLGALLVAERELLDVVSPARSVSPRRSSSARALRCAPSALKPCRRAR